jgi:hypothetical protein
VRGLAVTFCLAIGLAAASATAQEDWPTNDDRAIVPSIFNDTMQLDALSFIDQVIVRMLYDPTLAPGTPRAEALRIARTVLEELNPGG